MVENGPMARQPTKLDYESPTQFKFGIHQLPLVEYFVTAVDLPDIALGTTVMNTPFKDIPIPGEKLTYGPLSITFLIDEYMENYISLHDWITGLGFPEKRSQFSQFRDTTSNTPAKAGNQPAEDRIGSEPTEWQVRDNWKPTNEDGTVNDNFVFNKKTGRWIDVKTPADPTKGYADHLENMRDLHASTGDYAKFYGKNHDGTPNLEEY